MKSCPQLARESIDEIKGKLHCAKYALTARVSDADLEQALHFLEEASNELTKARSQIIIEIQDRKEMKKN